MNEGSYLNFYNPLFMFYSPFEYLHLTLCLLEEIKIPFSPTSLDLKKKKNGDIYRMICTFQHV